MRTVLIALAGLGCFASIASAQDAPSALIRGTAVHIPVVQDLLADKSIRDHVGISENNWDVSSPDSIPGFGPMPSAAPQVAAAGSSDD